jgi:antitoxin ParD1/3/4
VSISLSAELEDLIRRKVASGAYESPGQVLEEAMRLLEERDHLRQLRHERLLREIANGVFEADNRHLIESPEVFRSLTARAHVPDE